MYFRRLFSDKKTKLVYSNGLSQVHLSSPFSNGDNRTRHKTCKKLSTNYQETQKSQAIQRRCLANIVGQQQQKSNNYGTKKANIVAKAIQKTQINPKYNKTTTSITSLSGLYIWEQYEVPEIK